MKKILVTILVILLVLIAGMAAVAWWFYLGNSPANRSASVEMVYQSAVSQNASFASGAQLLNANRYTEAVPALEQALSAAKGAEEKTLISFYLSAAYRSSGNYAAAINTLQGVLSTRDIAPAVQALAVEEMATIYSTHTSSSTRTALFDNSLYRSFIATSTNQTVRRIYQYATSLYPLPYSNYAIARSYANSVIAIVNDDQGGQEALISELMLRLKAAITAGDAATTDTIDTFTYPSYRANALLERAIVLGKLEQLKDTSLGDASEAYRKALDLYARVGESDAVARLKFAHYLATRYGSSKAAEISSVLAPLYEVPQEQQRLRLFFARFGDATEGQTKSDLVLLAKLDPAFKTYLLSLGWAQADFK